MNGAGDVDIGNDIDRRAGPQGQERLTASYGQSVCGLKEVERNEDGKQD